MANWAKHILSPKFAAAFAVAVSCGQTDGVTVSGSLRTRVESWDWFEAPGNRNDYTYSGSILRVSVGQSRKSFDWQLELAAPVLLGLPDDAIAPGAQGQLGFGGSYFAANKRNTSAGMVFVKQGYVRLKKLKIGRMEFIDGTEVTPKNGSLAALKRERIAHRLLGNFVFSHVERSFDGIQLGFNQGSVNVTALAARPTRGVLQVDGWGELNINVFYGAVTGQFSGGEWRVFGLGYSDLRDGVAKTDNRSAAARTADRGHIHIGSYGAHYLQAVATGAGTFDALFWGVLQSGSWGAIAHRAYALAAEGGWQPPGPGALKPWIRAGYDYGSGDKDPGDGRHGTFFQVLPTPRVYARFPFFNMMNNRDMFVEAMVRPGRFTVRADIHSLRLANRNDLWYQGGGAFQPWTFGYTGRPSNGQASLATLYDGSVDYAANAHVTVGGYYGHAAGKLVPFLIYPAGKDANFGFLELTLRF